MHKRIDKFLFQKNYTRFYVFLIALAIFLLGVQIGIKQGRISQLEDMRIKYGYNFAD